MFTSRQEVIRIATEMARAVLKDHLDNPYIGEVYVYRHEEARHTSYYPVKAKSAEAWGVQFVPFKKRNISDQVEGKIKIFDAWFDVADVFYYADVYKDIRFKILNINRD